MQTAPQPGMEASRQAMEERLGDLSHLLFQGLDLLFQLEDPRRILLDHVADQAGIGG